MNRLIPITKRQTLIALSGVPGSGKSTFIRKFVDDHPDYGWQIIHPDAIREELTGDVNDQSRNKEVWALAYQRLREASAQGLPVIFDATLASPYIRREVAGSVPPEYHRVLVSLDTPLEESLSRNKQRKRVVPEHVIRRMYTSLKENPPDRSEGWTRIIRG